MKEGKKYIIAIVAVLAIIVAVAGATFAYWSWQSDSANNTSVSFTVPNDSALLSASIDGGTFNVAKLAPTTGCTGSYAQRSTVTLNYANASGATAVAKGTLTVSGWTAPHSPTSTDLTHLHYALTTTAGNCTSGDSGVMAEGTIGGNGAIINDLTLQSDIATGTANGSKTMYLYVWLDSTTPGANTGSAVTASMQDIAFTLTWSGTISNGS